MSARCYCGAYVPASRRRLGKDNCAACEAQDLREAAHWDLVNDLIDVVDAEPVRHYALTMGVSPLCLICGKSENHGYEITPPKRMAS